MMKQTIAAKKTQGAREKRAKTVTCRYVCLRAKNTTELLLSFALSQIKG